MSKKYHLLRELGISKSTLCFVLDEESGSDHLTDERVSQLRRLIDREGMSYTLAELEELSAVFCRSHDEVCDGECGCSSAEQRKSQGRFSKALDALEFIEGERDADNE